MRLKDAWAKKESVEEPAKMVTSQPEVSEKLPWPL